MSNIQNPFVLLAALAVVMTALALTVATSLIQQRALITCASSSAAASQITTAGYGTDRGWPQAFLQERPERVGSYDACSFSGTVTHFIFSAALVDFLIWTAVSCLVGFIFVAYRGNHV